VGHIRQQQAERSSSGFRRMCKQEHLSYLRVREWQDVHGQLRQVLRTLRITPNDEPGQPDQIHRSLLAGLLSHIGMKEGERQELLGPRNARFAIAPGSVLYKKPPQWVMVAELVETNRLWGRVAARIHPSWAEQLGAHLVKRSHGEPWWDERRGAGMVDERVTLYGLPLVTGRKVPYARISPDDARDMFIHHALVEGSWDTHHAFVEANRKLVEEVRALEDRARRRDILVGGEALFDFYDRRVGAGVTSSRHFDRWWKEERGRHPDLLSFTFEDVVDPAAGGVSLASYPDVWHHGDLALPLRYEFDPTSDLDGVTVDIPLPRMDDVDPAGFAWQVPGLREELVTALIRTLPKSLRRQIGAAGDHAPSLPGGGGSR
jgi:ATP-dependent helicase HrpA